MKFRWKPNRIFAKVAQGFFVLAPLVACGKTESFHSALRKEKEKVTIAQCKSERKSAGGGSKSDLATVFQYGRVIEIDYHTNATGEAEESGHGTIIGKLDPVYRQTHSKDALNLLLQSATWTYRKNLGSGGKETVTKLDKTEIARIDDRLFIEESDILLKFTGCTFTIPVSRETKR